MKAIITATLSYGSLPITVKRSDKFNPQEKILDIYQWVQKERKKLKTDSIVVNIELELEA